MDELAVAQDRANALSKDIKQLNESVKTFHEKFTQSTKALAG